MDSIERGALKLVWCIALSLIAISLVDLGLSLAVSALPGEHKPVALLTLLLKFVPAALGIALLVKARAIAAWISEKLED